MFRRNRKQAERVFSSSTIRPGVAVMVRHQFGVATPAMIEAVDGETVTYIRLTGGGPGYPRFTANRGNVTPIATDAALWEQFWVTLWQYADMRVQHAQKHRTTNDDWNKPLDAAATEARRVLDMLMAIAYKEQEV